MGSSKKITVSYWYKLIAHLGWCKGPINALREIRGGDRTAWKGRQEGNGILYIDKPDLYGGESAEGGIQGFFEVLMGAPAQTPNAYLASIFGATQSAYRGRASIVLRGAKIGAGNPYPKSLYFMLERTTEGWDDNNCWYPEKAPIPFAESDGDVTVVNPNVMLDSADTSLDGSDGGFDFTVPAGATIYIKPGPGSEAWSFTPSDDYQPENYHYLVWWNHFGLVNLTNPGVNQGTYWPERFYTAAEASAFHSGQQVLQATSDDSSHEYRLYLRDATIDDNRGSGSYEVGYITAGGYFAMNPAHILYDSITSRRENGGMEEPVGRINEASFLAAADKLFEEGFGLCCTWHGGESTEQFQQRILNVIGGSLTQSRKDGQYYLHLLRRVEDIDSLPTITDNDIDDWEAEPAVPPESINQISVKWFDPLTREERITSPVQSLGAIQDAGGIYADIRDYYEIPYEALALRVAQRDLQAVASALWKFTISCTRVAFDLMPGMQIRLLCPNRGFADVVVVIGDIDYGNLQDDTIRIIALQDVFALPDASYVDPQPSLDEPTPTDPQSVVEWEIQEAPYVALIPTLTPEEVESLEEEDGYIGVLARRPVNGVNYGLWTKAGGESFENYGNKDWTPSMRIVEGDDLSQETLQEEFTYEEEQLFDSVQAGQMVLWLNEICVIKEIDKTARSVRLGRGCADTVLQSHDPNTLAFVVVDSFATDERQYVQNEEVFARVTNRTPVGQVLLGDAPEKSIEMNARQTRPYPPANIKINGVPIFGIGASTPGGGGGGGGGGGDGGTPSGPPPTSAGGGPASTELGPNGGFPDDAPYWIPPVVTGEDVMDDDFSDPDVVLQHWRDRVGGPLGQGFTPEDGELRFHGITGSAYNWFRRYSFSPQPFPRYDVSVEMKVRTEFGQTARVGIAWGLNHSLDAGSETTNYIEASEAASYFEETVVSHTWRLERQFVSLSPYGYYAHVNFMPVVQFNVEPARQADAMADDAKMTITEVPVDMTPVDVENLDLADGLTGIDLWPDPDNLNPDSPAVTVEDGALVLTPTDAVRNFRNAYWADAVPVSEVGQYVKIVALVWCNDPSVDARGITTGGAHLYLAGKTVTDGYAVNGYYIAQRGDWTERVWYWRVQGVPGGSLLGHYVTAQMKCAPGYQVKVKILSVEITDEAQD